MISQTVEYALRAVATIAQHDGQACTARVIAEITKVPAAYLSKLMRSLVQSGLVHSQRGLHGGFVLAKDVEKLTIFDVVNAVEPFKRIRECPLGIHGSQLCALHRRLDNALESTERVFRETTMAEILAESGDSTPLCKEKEVLSLGRATKAKVSSTQKKKK